MTARKKKAKKSSKKKAAAKPPEKAVEPIAITPDEEKVNLDLEISTSDIVSIGVAEYENRVREGINQAKKDWKAAQRVEKAKQKKLTDLLNALVTKTYSAAVRKLNIALKGLKIETTVRLETGFFDTKKGTLSASVSHFGSTSHLEVIDVTPEIRAADKEVEAAKKVVETEKQRLVSLQGELTNMAYAERQIKAKVSEAALKGSKQGKALLKAVGVAKFVPQLPG